MRLRRYIIRSISRKFALFIRFISTSRRAILKIIALLSIKDFSVDNEMIKRHPHKMLKGQVHCRMSQVLREKV